MQKTEETKRESLTMIWEGEREKRMLKLFMVRDISL
jgi:hypothetical protein